MPTTSEGTENVNNDKARSAATAHLVDTDQISAARTRNADAGASNQPRTRADAAAQEAAREHADDATTPDQGDHAGKTSRTWTYTHRFSGQTGTVTCMTGCRFDHEDDQAKPVAPEDIFCWSEPNCSDTTVPVDLDKGKPENFDLLTAYLAVDPFSANIADRLPHAVVEILDQQYVTPLDPDALASLISLLASRLDGLRQVHADLVRTRAEYIARQAVAA